MFLIRVEESDIVMASEARKANKPADEANPIAFALQRTAGTPAKADAHTATWQAGDTKGKIGHRARRLIERFEAGRKVEPFDELFMLVDP